MSKVINEIIYEYKMYVDNLDFEIKGRILKNVDESEEYIYSWEVSHFCKPSENAAGVYIPSTSRAKTIKEAKVLLFSYMDTFTNIDVETNNYY